MPTLTIEQLRGVVATRLGELEAYKYMDQVLSQVQAATKTVEESKKELAAANQSILDMQVTIADLEQKASDRAVELEAEHAKKASALQAKLDEMQRELDRKAAGLAEYQGQLKKIDADHNAAIAAWQERTTQVRAEHKAAVDQLEAAKKQFDALAAMVGRK